MRRISKAEAVVGGNDKQVGMKRDVSASKIRSSICPVVEHQRYLHGAFAIEA